MAPPHNSSLFKSSETLPMLQIWNAYTEEQKQMRNMKSDLGVETKNKRIWPKIQRLVELFCKIPELVKNMGSRLFRNWMKSSYKQKLKHSQSKAPHFCQFFFWTYYIADPEMNKKNYLFPLKKNTLTKVSCKISSSQNKLWKKFRSAKKFWKF